jgi:hypothetical protein
MDQAHHQLKWRSQLLDIIKPNHSSMISQVRARNALRVVVADQVAENGEVKSRRKTSRLSAKEVLTTVTVVDSAVVAVDEDTGEEAMVEMANPSAGVVDIEAVRRTLHRVPHNYDMATT